jgi:SpoIID/LytB domain protein
MVAVGAVDSEYMRPLTAVLLTAALAGLCTAVAWASGQGVRGGEAPLLVVVGAGDGHGVGMSQEGALGYAEHGYSYQAILAHYYTGTTLGVVSPHTRVRVLVAGRVRSLPLEAYVRGVVGAEMPPSWPLAALQAQAVAARTFALTAHAGGARFDVYSDARSQVYLGTKAQTTRTNEAVATTAGQVVTYGGRPAVTYYFASSGGATESVQNAFPGAAGEPWLRGVADPFDQGPEHRWTATMTFATAAARLGGLVRGAFRGVEVLRRGYSPRIVAAYVLGSGGPTEVSGPELAGRLGLYDTWAFFSVRTAHGVQPELDVSHRAAPEPAAPATEAPVGATSPGAPAPGACAPGASTPCASPPSAPPARTEPPGPEGGTTAGRGPSVGEGGGTTPP